MFLKHAIRHKKKTKKRNHIFGMRCEFDKKIFTVQQYHTLFVIVCVTINVINDLFQKQGFIFPRKTDVLDCDA